MSAPFWSSQSKLQSFLLFLGFVAQKLHVYDPPASHVHRPATERLYPNMCTAFEYPLLYRHFPYSILTFTDRLYLASYSEPPTEHTLFPYPDPEPRSPRKRSQRTVDQVAERKKPYYFTVDDTLLYNAFHHDFGPFHIGHLYRFALQFHEILGAKENKDRPVVFWSRADPRSRLSKSAFCAYDC